MKRLAIAAAAICILPMTSVSSAEDSVRAAQAIREYVINTAVDRDAASAVSRGYLDYQVAEYCEASGTREDALEKLNGMKDALREIETISGLSDAALGDLWTSNRTMALSRLAGASDESRFRQCNAAANALGSMKRFLSDRIKEAKAKVLPQDAISVKKPF